MDTDTQLESYRLCVGPADAAAEDRKVIHVEAQAEEDAIFRAGIVACGEYGLEAADWIVHGVQSQTDFMFDSGDDLRPMPARRRAHVAVGSRTIEEMARVVRAYLPGGYQVTGSMYVDNRPVIVIEGTDIAGWTLDDYVIPRLGSGMIHAHEVPLIEASAPDMPAEPFPGHKYVHASGDCSC
jgi:hypothetical protein